MTLTRHHGHRSGQKTSQRNTTITPEMEASKWQPGQSGNPGGRPKKTPITDELRRLLDEEYAGRERRFKGLSNARVLALVMYEEAIAGSLPAAKEIAERCEGKVPQRQELGGPDGGAIPWLNLSREENERRLTVLMAKAGLEN
jgi:hypothetical protein